MTAPTIEMSEHHPGSFRTPIIIRHQGIGRVSESEPLQILGRAGNFAAVPRDEIVDTAQFSPDVEGGSWDRANGYLWIRAREIRRAIETSENPRVLYFGAMPEVPHAIALGAYLGDEWPIEVFDSDRDPDDEVDGAPTTNRWEWPESRATLTLITTGLPIQASNATGPAVVRVEISATVEDSQVHDRIGHVDIANVRIRPSAEIPLVGKTVVSIADVATIRREVRKALGAIVEHLKNIETIHLFVAAPASVSFVIGQELRLRNMPPVQTYRYRRTNGVHTTREAIRLVSTGPETTDLPVTEGERSRGNELRTKLWEASLRDIERYAMNKMREAPSEGERWYARLEPRAELRRLSPFPTLPAVYTMIEPRSTVDVISLDPPQYYGYQRGERVWRVNDRFLLKLDQTFKGDLDDARSLVRMFMFHESLHVAHGITKSKFEEVGKFANCLEHVDYTADLYAILHEIDWSVQGDPTIVADVDALKQRAAHLIELVVRSFWAFEDPAPLERMEIRRIRRYMNWYWQRERVLRTRSFLQLAAVLTRKPVVEVAGLEPAVEGRRYFGKLRRFDTSVGLELGIVLDNEELKRIPTSVNVPIEELMKAFSNHDHEQIKQAFRQIYDEAETSKWVLPHEEYIP